LRISAARFLQRATTGTLGIAMADIGAHHTRALSKREVITICAGALILLGLGIVAREYTYPWLGISVIGLTGLLPFYVAWGLVCLWLRQFPMLHRNGLLFLSISIPLAILSAILVLWLLRWILRLL
jgi:hypothetical protein